MRLGRSAESRCLYLLLLVLLALTRSARTQEQQTEQPSEEEEEDQAAPVEFDEETGQEVLKPAVAAGKDQQEEDDLPDIVLMGDERKHQARKEPVILYQTGKSEEDLPECHEKNQVCSKVDTYGNPWVERQCRCPFGQTCSRSLRTDDGHTITDKKTQYKICEPVKRLPYCHFFNDVAMSIIHSGESSNTTIQRIHCRCRPESSAYLINIQYYRLNDGQPAFIYSFGCSMQKRIRCQAKEPCRLFSVNKKKSQLEQVTDSPLCSCAKGFRCPRRHTDPGSLPSKFYDQLGGKVYRGHCMPMHHPNDLVYTLLE